MKPKLKLGEALVQAGYIDDFQLQSALGQQKRWGGRLGKALLDLGFIDETTLIKFLSERMKYPAIDLSRSKISEKAFQALPKHVAEKYIAVPILIKDTPVKKTLVLAMADPTDLKALDEIEFVTNYKVEPYVALESSIQKILRNYGRTDETAPEKTAIVLEETASAPPQFVQGDMDMVEEVRRAYETAGQPAENAAEAPHPRAGTDLERSALRPELPAVDFEQPFPGDEEYVSSVDENDSPLEMIPDDDIEDADVAEADVLEDLEPVEEPEPPGQPGDPVDPYRFDPTAEPPLEEDLLAVETVEPACKVAQAEEVTELSEEADSVPLPDAPEAFPPEVEARQEPEEAAETAEADEILPEAVVEAEAAHEEAVPAEDARNLNRKLESCELEIAQLRDEIRRLSGKIVGLISLFILHQEGKLSTEDFLMEMREL